MPPYNHHSAFPGDFTQSFAPVLRTTSNPIFAASKILT